MNNDPSASPGEKSLRSELGDFFVDANRLITDWGEVSQACLLGCD